MDNPIVATLSSLNLEEGQQTCMETGAAVDITEEVSTDQAHAITPIVIEMSMVAATTVLAVVDTRGMIMLKMRMQGNNKVVPDLAGCVGTCT
jgi:hypothetical protein